MHLKSIPILALSLLLAGSVQAHDQAKGPNGGPLVTIEGKHLELTTAGTEITVYLSDEKHAPMTGTSGRAVVQEPGKTATVPLAPAAPNRLVGKAQAPVSKGARVVVSATLPDGKSLQARFVAN